jgi:hypothetical protein
MTWLRMLALTGIIAVAAAVAALEAQAQPSPSPAVVKPTDTKPFEIKPIETKPQDLPVMTFVVAKGEANACGPGCNAWIAADGKIDVAAPQRLRELLAKLGQRKLPLFLNSPGGAVVGSIALGRLIRSEMLAVSVARTIPSGCNPGRARDIACEALMRSGEDLTADLDPTGAMCNSGCVLALAGGVVRTVPPWTKLGVHAIGFNLEDTWIHNSAFVASKSEANAHIVEFLRDMGISNALFDTANVVPFTSRRFLERDELVRFGIDTRSFGETNWRFIEKPIAMQKEFFARTGKEESAYPNALLRVSCGIGKMRGLTFSRQRIPNVPTDAGLRPLRLVVNGSRANLASVTMFGNETRTTFLPATSVDSADDKSVIEIYGFDPEQKEEPQSSITLTMNGFSAAYAKLREACTISMATATSRRCAVGDISQRCILEALKARQAIPWTATPPKAVAPKAMPSTAMPSTAIPPTAGDSAPGE